MIGATHVFMFRKDELGVVQLSLIAVRKRYRRRGLGRRLINVSVSVGLPGCLSVGMCTCL